MLAKAKIRPRIALETNSYELMRNVAGEGMCLTFTTTPLDDPFAQPRAGSYIPLKDPRARPQRLALSVHRGRNLPLAVETFLGELRSRARAAGAAGERASFCPGLARSQLGRRLVLLHLPRSG